MSKKLAAAKPRLVSEAKKAANLYSRFTGDKQIEALEIDIEPLPKAVTLIGECDGVLYTTVRDGVVEKYKHEFRRGSKPLLCASPDGKRLFLVGGSFQFGARGIVDTG